MKKVILIISGLVLAGLIFLFIEGRKMQEVRTEIIIDAPPAKVWSVLADINKWHEWSPIINQSSGTASIGSKIDITMAGKEGKDGPQYSPKITEIEDAKYFRWRAHMMAGFIFTNDKVFELEEAEGGTKLVHKELFSGLLAPVFCGKMEEGVPPMLNAMNKALKDLVEKN